MPTPRKSRAKWVVLVTLAHPRVTSLELPDPVVRHGRPPRGSAGGHTSEFLLLLPFLLF